jgi:hypothetical protein
MDNIEDNNFAFHFITKKNDSKIMLELKMK